MPHSSTGYLAATRHPWSCLLFILPLLIAYELGVFLVGAGQPDLLRNGADAWLRWALQTLGMSYLWVAPMLLAVGLLAWSWLRWHDRPREPVGVWLGMTVESAMFALGLWGVSR